MHGTFSHSSINSTPGSNPSPPPGVTNAPRLHYGSRPASWLLRMIQQGIPFWIICSILPVLWPMKCRAMSWDRSRSRPAGSRLSGASHLDPLVCSAVSRLQPVACRRPLDAMSSTPTSQTWPMDFANIRSVPAVGGVDRGRDRDTNIDVFVPGRQNLSLLCKFNRCGPQDFCFFLTTVAVQLCPRLQRIATRHLAWRISTQQDGVPAVHLRKLGPERH